ncbi:hypothetical protein KR084_001528, partial [Drosophila pseudotakahashii]
PGTPPAGEKSTPKAAEEEQGDVLKQLSGLGSKARELKRLMDGKRSITNPMRDIVDEIDYLQREVLSAVQGIIEEQEKAKETAKKTCAEVLASGTSKRPRCQETGKTQAVPAKKAMHEAPASNASQSARKGKHAGTESTSKPQKPGKKPEEWQQVRQKTRKPRMRPPRNDAIVIATSTGGSYADILKKVKAEPQLKELGQAVQAVRRTAKGELLILLNKVADPKTAELQSTMKAVLGSNVDVRALTETMLVEVKDIDEITEKTDILCAVKSQFDVELPESAVMSLRAAYGGTQTATIRVMP